MLSMNNDHGPKNFAQGDYVHRPMLLFDHVYQGYYKFLEGLPQNEHLFDIIMWQFATTTML
jgi:hypothetical protein